MSWQSSSMQINLTDEISPCLVGKGHILPSWSYTVIIPVYMDYSCFTVHMPCIQHINIPCQLGYTECMMAVYGHNDSLCPLPKPVHLSCIILLIGLVFTNHGNKTCTIHLIFALHKAALYQRIRQIETFTPYIIGLSDVYSLYVNRQKRFAIGKHKTIGNMIHGLLYSFLKC